MRPDMHRVVIERPRRGAGFRNRGSALKIRPHLLEERPEKDWDGPARLPMSMNARSTRYSWKEFSDLLGPLRKWLHKQVGRRWDDVYSDIRQVFPNRSSEPIRHVWEAHVSGWVEQNCRMGTNGEVYCLRKYGDAGWASVKDCYYIHPINGLLLWAPRHIPPKSKWPYRYPKASYDGSVWDPFLRTYTAAIIDAKLKTPYKMGDLALSFGADSRFVLRRGVWYLFKFSQAQNGWLLDSVKQLSRVELRRHGLRNSSIA